MKTKKEILRELEKRLSEAEEVHREAEGSFEGVCFGAMFALESLLAFIREDENWKEVEKYSEKEKMEYVWKLNKEKVRY